MDMPTVNMYGPYQEPYGTHCLSVSWGNMTVWYSYRTIVAFQVKGFPRVVRRNDWSTTTGTHLNAIDGGDKKSRISGEVFERMLRDALEHN